MDVGTAKPTAAERRGVPHHLLDVLDVTRGATGAGSQRAGAAALAGVAARDRQAVLVGGSGLYVRAVLDGLELPPTDPAVRARLEGDVAREGPAALHARLATVDPAAAAAILASNGRRIVRALEVVELTGRPFRATLPDGAYAMPAVQVGLDVPRDVLAARVAGRVDRMWQAGLGDEGRALGGRGPRPGRPPPPAPGGPRGVGQPAGGMDREGGRGRD